MLQYNLAEGTGLSATIGGSAYFMAENYLQALSGAGFSAAFRQVIDHLDAFGREALRHDVGLRNVNRRPPAEIREVIGGKSGVRKKHQHPDRE